MITANRSGEGKKRVSRIQPRKVEHSVWYEAKRGGGYVIYCGIKGTDIKTKAGSAMSRETLALNIRMAKVKFGLLPVNHS
jgi:hypothetical protein